MIPGIVNGFAFGIGAIIAIVTIHAIFHTHICG